MLISKVVVIISSQSYALRKTESDMVVCMTALQTIIPLGDAWSGEGRFEKLSISTLKFTTNTLRFRIHSPLLCVSQQCPGKLSKLCEFS